MLRRVEPYVAWGYPNLKTVRELLYKRGFGKVPLRLAAAMIHACKEVPAALVTTVVTSHMATDDHVCLDPPPSTPMSQRAVLHAFDARLLYVQVNKDRIPLTDNTIVEKVSPSSSYTILAQLAGRCHQISGHGPCCIKPQHSCCLARGSPRLQEQPTYSASYGKLFGFKADTDLT